LEKEDLMSINVLFLTVVKIDHVSEKGIYTDLMRQFLKAGDHVTIICPLERRYKLETRILKDGNLTIIQVKTLNFQKASLLEKGIATLIMDSIFLKAAKKSLKYISKYDLVLYSTPPITFSRTVGYIKKKCQALSYLLLKDIFPQNAIDLGMMRYGSFLHKYFLSKEKELYKISDMIGCMSPANQQYLLRKHPELAGKVEINPNSIEINNVFHSNVTRDEIFSKYSIPKNVTVFIYGGNLGKPQGAYLLTEVISRCIVACPDAYFIIVGDGTDYKNIEKWFIKMTPPNAMLLHHMPKEHYDALLRCADVGLILLRSEFTIPNFPSRLLSYLENDLPVLSIIDTATDVGTISEEVGFGKWCKYGDIESILYQVKYFADNKLLRHEMGKIGNSYLKKEYDVKMSYGFINDFISNAQRNIKK